MRFCVCSCVISAREDLGIGCIVIPMLLAAVVIACVRQSRRIDRMRADERGELEKRVAGGHAPLTSMNARHTVLG